MKMQTDVKQKTLDRMKRIQDLKYSAKLRKVSLTKTVKYLNSKRFFFCKIP